MKKVFGGGLTLLGVVGLIYGAVTLVQHGLDFSSQNNTTVAAIVAFIVGLIFFTYGISLLKSTEESTHIRTKNTVVNDPSSGRTTVIKDQDTDKGL